MAKQTFTTGQVLTAAQMTSLQQTAMGGGAATAKTASYVLTAADAGTVVQMNSASATTITVNTALFAAGDTVQIQNVGAGVCTVTAGTATVSTSSTLALKQYDAGSLYFNSTSAAIFFASDAADGSSPLTTKGDLYGFSTLDARIPIGTNNQVLTADSAQALGLKWATPSSGAMVLVKARTTFTTATDTSTTFDGVFTSTYKNYMVIIDYINGSVGGGGSTLNMVFRYGGVSQTAYAGNTNQVNYAGTVTNIGGTSAAAIGLGQLYLDQSLFTITMGGMGVASSAGQLTHYAMVSALAGSANGGWYSNNARTYDGFQLSASSGTITGSATVYGLAVS
jgi:hypothetical protein